MITRRNLIGAGAVGLAAASGLGQTAFTRNLTVASIPTDRRFVFIIQRGAADGLGTVAPMGDPGFAPIRREFVNDFEGGLKFDGMFTLHPNLEAIGALYQQKQALFVHAVATPYHDRSHFDGQNVLESGVGEPYKRKDGWMNRLLSLVPSSEAGAIAISTTIPLALRGSINVSNFAPTKMPEASDDLRNAMSTIYQQDRQFGSLWAQATRTREAAGQQNESNKQAQVLGSLAGKLLGEAGAAQVAFIETAGWDTHANQRGRLGRQLRELDALVEGLRAELGQIWKDTLVIIATEFGRTAQINGTNGTDHGNASVAMLLGGTISGGRVAGDWPGLATSSLYNGRDLRPTTDLFQLIGQASSAHLGIDPAKAMPAMFPGSDFKTATMDFLKT